MTDLGWPELLIVAAIAMLLFGTRKMPDVARSIGRSMRILKAEVSGLHDDEPAPAATAPAATEPAATAPAATEPAATAPAAAAPTAPAAADPRPEPVAETAKRVDPPTR